MIYFCIIKLFSTLSQKMELTEHIFGEKSLSRRELGNWGKVANLFYLSLVSTEHNNRLCSKCSLCILPNWERKLAGLFSCSLLSKFTLISLTVRPNHTRNTRNTFSDLHDMILLSNKKGNFQHSKKLVSFLIWEFPYYSAVFVGICKHFLIVPVMTNLYLTRNIDIVLRRF